MAESLPKDSFDLVFRFDIKSTEYKNNTAFDKTTKTEDIRVMQR